MRKIINSERVTPLLDEQDCEANTLVKKGNYRKVKREDENELA
jgi:hypothetical protein